MPVFRAECDYSFDPPHVNLFLVLPPPIGDQFLTNVPLHDYNRVREQFGFPDIVCDGPA